jgi:hypothetical protein
MSPKSPNFPPNLLACTHVYRANFIKNIVFDGFRNPRISENAQNVQKSFPEFPEFPEFLEFPEFRQKICPKFIDFYNFYKRFEPET